MLLNLQVRNFAIIDELEVDFAPGMTVLTGETGAGKSILVDALGLALGARGGSAVLREGAGRAEFSASFELAGLEEASAWLGEQSLDRDNECVVRRVINADGRSRAFINGTAVPLQSVSDLGDLLVDVHGQHFHQSLVRRDVQRDLLDHFGGLGAQREDVASAYIEWQEVAGKLHALREAEQDRESRLDLLTFQVREIETLDIRDGEYEALLSERQRFRMSSQLVEAVGSALRLLSEDEQANVQQLLAEAGHAIDAVSDVDEPLRAAKALIDEALIGVSEAADSLQRYGESLDMDPERRDVVEERLDAIAALARKHRVEADELPGLLSLLQEELAQLSDSAAATAKLENQVTGARASYLELATRLSGDRQKTATRFSSAVTGAMHGLGMPDGRFEARLRTREPDDGRAWGLDDVEFLITANAGQPPMPLARVASGGELSRMSLAIQVIASDGSSIPTMVFDEVDSGVGGRVAEMVGRRLKDLGAARQVLCVTHLPQVASLADNHYRIHKVSDGKSTRIELARLKEKEKIDELARMLGGVRITARTRDHAAEMRKAGKRRGKKSKAAATGT